MDICATFQASSADCERGFSLMNHIKTESRNRLEVAHSDQLMRIKSKLEADGAINLDKVYNHWRSEKTDRQTDGKNKVKFKSLIRFVFILE